MFQYLTGNIWEGEIQHLPQTVTPEGPAKSSKVKVASTHPPWPEAAGACSVGFAGGGGGASAQRPGLIVTGAFPWTRGAPAPHLNAPGADKHPAAVGGSPTRQAVLTSSQRALVLKAPQAPGFNRARFYLCSRTSWPRWASAGVSAG